MAKSFGKDLRLLTAKAASWSVLRVGWSSVWSFAVFSVMTRLLDTQHVGLFALAMSFVEVTRVLAGAGLADALMRQAEVDDEIADTAFWGGLLLSLLIAGLLAALAPLFAAAMKNDELMPVIWALAGLLPITAAGRVHTTLRLREFGHKAVALRNIAVSALAGVCALVAAYLGAAVWALVLQVAITEVAGLILAWSLHSWTPRLRMDFARLRPLLSFGGGMVLTQMLWAVLSRIPDFFIGHTLGASAVGVYRVAWRLVELLGQVFLQPLAGVALITFSKLQAEPDALERAYCRLLGLGAITMIPVVLGFGMVAHDLIPLLFGEKWRPAASVAQILSLSALPFVANYFFAPLLAAKGKSYQISQIALVQLLSTALISYFAAPYGLLALTAAYVIRGYLTLPLIQYALSRHGDVRIRRSIETLLPAVSGGVAMCLAVFAAQTAPIEGAFMRLTFHVAVGATVYVGYLLIFARSTVMSHWSALQPLISSLRQRV